MFSHLVLALRAAGLPASITEYLTLMAAMKAGVADYSTEDFYYLARATLVKDERHLDKFDRVFAQCFKGLEPPEGVAVENLPEEWLRKLAEKLLSPEEMAKIQALGGFDAIMNRAATAPSLLNPDVSPDLEHVILKATQKDRALRYPTAGEMLADLRRVQRHDATASATARRAPTVRAAWLADHVHRRGGSDGADRDSHPIRADRSASAGEIPHGGGKNLAERQT